MPIMFPVEVRCDRCPRQVRAFVPLHGGGLGAVPFTPPPATAGEPRQLRALASAEQCSSASSSGGTLGGNLEGWRLPVAGNLTTAPILCPEHAKGG